MERKSSIITATVVLTGATLTIGTCSLLAATTWVGFQAVDECNATKVRLDARVAELTALLTSQQEELSTGRLAAKWVTLADEKCPEWNCDISSMARVYMKAYIETASERYDDSNE